MALGDRVLGLLMSMYPSAFRRRFGQEMLDAFRRDRARPVFRGTHGGLRYWAHVVRDVLRTLPSAWVTRGDAVPPGRLRNGRMGPWVRDFRFVLRGLRREPGFTVVAVLTMGLGIGAATSVFTVVYGVLLSPLPFPESNRLVRVWELQRENPGARMVAYGNYVDLRERGEGDVLEDLAIWAYSAHTLTGVGPAQRLRTREVSANFARVFGVPPIIGRWVSPDEERQGDRVVVLAHHVWRDMFGLDSSLVGQSVRLENAPYTVIGIMPPGYVFPPTADAWVPLQPVTSPMGLRRWHRHAMVGRLLPGVSHDEVARRLRILSDELSERSPETNAGDYFEAQSLRDALVGDVRPALRMLFGACAVLMLIACVNIASLLLARTTTRSREFAVRRALGATRGRIVGYLALESLVLGVLGGVLGLLLALGSTAVLPRLAAGTVPRLDQVRVGLPVGLFAAVASIASAMIVSVGPALRGSKREEGPAAALRTGRGGAVPSVIRNRRWLVGAELVLAVVLVATAALLIKSFARLTAVDTGVQAGAVLTMDVRVPGRDTSDGAAVARRTGEMLRAFEQIPGVEQTAAVLTEPVDATGWFNTLAIRDRPVPEVDRPAIGYNVITPQYFDVVGVPLVAGRRFDASDVESPDLVVIVNRAAAERYWPDRDPLGSMILGDPDTDLGWSRVVGVVENIRQSLWEPAWPEVFVPLEQEPLSSVVVVARTAGDPTILGPTLIQAARRWEPDMPVNNVEPLSVRIGSTIGESRFSALLMGTFAGVALLLACVGVYGVLAYAVAARRREFGIRMAVGAPRRRVLLGVLREAGMLGAVAVLIGLAGSVAVSRLATSMLFEVGPVDRTVLGGVAALVFGVSLVAGLVPAQTATAVDPARVLREE